MVFLKGLVCPCRSKVNTHQDSFLDLSVSVPLLSIFRRRQGAVRLDGLTCRPARQQVWVVNMPWLRAANRVKLSLKAQGGQGSGGGGQDGSFSALG